MSVSIRTGRTRLAVVGLAAVLLGAGCGVPSQTDVKVEGPPVEAGGDSAGDSADPPPGPDEANSADELVEYFLQAAATDPENAVEVLREFIHPDVRDDWEPAPPVYVARISDPVPTRGDPDRFDLTVRRVGVLNPDGVVEPRTFQEEDFTLAVAAGGVADQELPGNRDRYWLVEPPKAFILLDDAALQRHFEWRPIYFWDNDRGQLVPDIRWLRRAVPERQRPQTVVDWLLAGPSPWLTGTVATLPQGVELRGNVVPSEDQSRVEVRMLAPPELDASTLEAQLWWSLRPDLAPGVEVALVINDTERLLRDNYVGSNPVPPAAPASFAVLDGTVVQYLPDEPMNLAALPEQLNTGVERAAVSRDGRLAALVRSDDSGQQRLSVLKPGSDLATDLVAQSIGQPVWLNNPPGTGLVAAGGELWQFTSGDSAVAPVDLELTGSVTAVAVAPDGRRLAVVVDGRLYLAPLARAGDVISISATPVALPTTATDLEGVGFIREEWLAIVGTGDGQTRLYELTVDGALERELPGGPLGTPGEIRTFVTYPGDPTQPDERGMILYETGGFMWRYQYPREPVQVLAADLLEEEPDEGVPEPRSPFFLD